MRLLLHSPHPAQDCAERLRAAIAEPGVRKIAEHEGEWPVYGRASSHQFYLGAIERRFGVQGRSRLSALGHVEGEVSERAAGAGVAIRIRSERPKRYRWVAILMFVALLPIFFSALLRASTAWGEGDTQTLIVSGLFIVLEIFVLMAFLSPWGFERVRKEDRRLLECLLAVCDATVVGEEGPDDLADTDPAPASEEGSA